MGTNISSGVALLALTFLSACGTDSLTIDDASAVATASATVVTQANAALDTAKARRERANEILIASDPNCSLTPPIYTFTPTSPGATPGPVCAKGPNDTLPGYRVTQMKAPMVTDADLRPTVALIGALADYEAALTKVKAEAAPDLTKQIQGISDKATDAETFAKLAGSSALPKLPTASQLKAATDILTFVETIQQQHGQAKEIKKLVIAQRAKFADLVPQLKEQLQDWQKATTTGYSEEIVGDLSRIYERDKAKLDFPGRLGVVAAIRQGQADLLLIPKTAETLSKAIDAFATADAELGNVVDDKLSDADRKKVAETSLQQIYQGLHLVASAITAWGIV